MGKKKTSLNAIDALMQISREIEGSNYTIPGNYDPGIFQASRSTGTKATTKEELAASALFQSNLKKPGKLLSATPVETLLFVAFCTILKNRCYDIRTRDLFDFSGLKGLDFLPLSNHLVALLKKRFLYLSERFNRLSRFRSGRKATKCILKNEPYKKAVTEIIDRYKYCRSISNFKGNTIGFAC